MGAGMEAATVIAAAGAPPAALPDHDTSPGLAAVVEVNTHAVRVESPDDAPTVAVPVERRHSFACSCGACPPGPVLRVDGPRHRTAAGRRRPAFGWLIAAGAAAVVALVLGVVFLLGRDPNAAAAQHTVATAGLPSGSPLSLTPAPPTSGVLSVTPSAARPAPGRSAPRTAAPNDAAPLAPALSALVLATGSAGATVGKITGTTSVIETTPSPTPKRVAESSGQDTDPAPVVVAPAPPVVAAPATFSAADAYTALLVCQAALGPTGHARTPAVGSAATAPPVTGWPCYVDLRPTPSAPTDPSTDTATGGS